MSIKARRYLVVYELWGDIHVALVDGLNEDRACALRMNKAIHEVIALKRLIANTEEMDVDGLTEMIDGEI